MRRGTRGSGEGSGEEEIVWLKPVFSVHRVSLPIEERFSFFFSEEDVDELPAVDKGTGSEDEFLDYFETFRDVFEVEERTEVVVVRVKRLR